MRNKLNLTAHSELRPAEYALTNIRLVEINQGSGPSGNFDTAHLKAIHRYIFQDVYEWAGHTRNESPVVDGQRVEPVGGLFQGGTSFLPGSRIEMGLNEALRPIADPPALSKATPEQFAERAAKVLSEPNYVHPFREGNGRAQEAFISELGRHYGHAIDFSLITMPRMIEASIETTNDPSSPLMKHAIEDAMKPGRREAIRSAFDDLRESGEEPLHHHVRTARAGEDITGRVLRQDDRFASLLTDHGIVVADRADLPEDCHTTRRSRSLLGRTSQTPNADGICGNPFTNRKSLQQPAVSTPAACSSLR